MRKHHHVVDRPARRWPVVLVAAVLSGAAIALAPAFAAATWPGLTVAPEHRCSPYDRQRHYPYPQSDYRTQNPKPT